LTTISGYTWYILIAAETTEEYKLTSTALGLSPKEEANNYLVWTYHNATFDLSANSKVMIFNSSMPLVVPIVPNSNHFMAFFSPIFAINGMSILGELNKWVPMSAQRVVYVQVRATGITVGLQGAPAELITFAFTWGASNTVVFSECVLNGEGRMYLVLGIRGNWDCTPDGEIVYSRLQMS